MPSIFKCASCGAEVDVMMLPHRCGAQKPPVRVPQSPMRWGIVVSIVLAALAIVLMGGGFVIKPPWAHAEQIHTPCDEGWNALPLYYYAQDLVQAQHVAAAIAAKCPAPPAPVPKLDTFNERLDFALGAGDDPLASECAAARDAEKIATEREVKEWGQLSPACRDWLLHGSK